MAYLLHAAGWLNEGRDSPERYRRHLTDVQLLLRNAGAFFLGTPEFLVRRFADDGRLLVLERLDGTIDGCIAYELVELPTLDEVTGDVVQRRLCFIRLLAVRQVPLRRHLAYGLALEAMLRGTVRSLNDNEDLPQAAGTVGVIMESNERGLRWAAGLGGEVELATPAFVRPFDPTIAALTELTERICAESGGGTPYRLVLAKRTALAEAADLHRKGGRGMRISDDGPFVIYDPADPYRRAIEVAVQNITDRNPTTLRKLGMIGRASATAWGAPYAPRMGITLGRFSTERMS